MVVSNIYEVINGRVDKYTGNYSKYVTLRKERYELWEKEYLAQQEEISKMQDYIDKNLARASTSKSAKSRIKALENMEIIDEPDKDIKPIKLKFETTKQPFKDVLKVENKDLNFSNNIVL